MNDLFAAAPIKKAYFKLSLPMVLGMLTVMVYNLADTYFISQTGQPALVAGVTIVVPLFTFLMAVANIFAIGGSSLLSRLFGQKKLVEAKRLSAVCINWGLLLGLVLTALLLLGQKTILLALGARGAVYRQAQAFYQVIAWGSLPIIFSVIPQNFLRTEGLAAQAMIATVVGTASAIMLDPLVLFVWHWGAMGVGLANVTGYLISDLLLLFVMVKQSHFIKLSFHHLKFTKQEAKAVFGIGLPGSITNFAATFGLALLNYRLAPYGADQLAAMGIAQKIYNSLILVMTGFAFGAQPLIGYNFGAKNWPRLRGILRFDFKVETIFALAAGGLTILLAQPLIAIFMNQPVIIKAGSLMLVALLVTTPLVGWIFIFTTVFQSVDNAWGALLMAIARQGLVYAAALLMMESVWGYQGLIWAQAISDLLTCFLGWLLYHASRLPQEMKKDQK